MKPLNGLRLLTLEQFGAGPYGTMFLADLGAEVIKIENDEVGGDPGRHVGPRMLGEGDSEYFQTWGSNKKSITLDLKDDGDRGRFHRLAATADALVNNLRGDQPEKLGLDFASLKSVNPRIVCLHISAYGRDNERRAWPGYDYLMQAEAGLMSLTGEPNGPPCRMGSAIIDFMTGITGMVGLLSCCQWRSKKGPPRRCKKGPLGGCGLVPVVHGRAPRATRRALNRLTRRRAREGPVGPRGQAWAGWSVQLAVGV